MATNRKRNSSVKRNGSKRNGKLSRRALLAGLGAGLTLTSAAKGSALDMPDPTPTPGCIELTMNKGGPPSVCMLPLGGSITIKRADSKLVITAQDGKGKTLSMTTKARQIIVKEDGTVTASCGT